MGYSGNVIRGISWMSGFRMLTRALSFLKIAIIARVLTPSQFGVFGIASLVMVFLEMLTETGINIILIQVKKEIDEYIDSAWVVSIIRGAIISLCIFLFAPLIASFFNIPDALNILRLISIVPLIKGFINPAEIKFLKDLKFHYEFWLRSSIFIFDATISVIFVVLTHSVYGLVWGLIAGALLEVLLSFMLMKPIPRLHIRKNYLREIFHKGKWVTAYGLFNYLAQEGDNIVVGKIIGASALGVYQMAYKLSTLPISEVTDVVSKVVFPVYAIIGGDKTRLKAAFIKSTLTITVAATAMGAILFLFPKEIVHIILGDKWLSVVPILRVLAAYGVLRAISGSASALFLGVGKQRYVTSMTFLRFVGLAITIYPFIRIFGLVGAGYSALISVVIEIPVISYYVIKVFRK
ncbi:MAG: lipopolysaccharide biosynthesis protein [bacterium]|nr:lipopolysaccharide biosynthesis protein [bacterium]